MMNLPGAAGAAPPPIESIHPTLSSESLGSDGVGQVTPFVTDPNQFLMNLPTEKPFTTQVPAALFDECVQVLKRTVQWRVSSTRYNGALPHGRRYIWRKHYVCDHSGKPRDRRNPNLAPGKRRSRRASIKIGCPASFTATQEVGSETVTMVCRFQHQGHTVNTREYWASSRIPDNVRDWIKDRVAEGHDQKEIVQMIHEHQKTASNMPASSPSFIPPGVQITRMDVYNIIKRFRANQAKAEQGDTPTRPRASAANPGAVAAAHATPGLEARRGSAGTPGDAGAAAGNTSGSHALDPTAAAETAAYSLLPTPAQLAPASPEEAVSFAQQYSDLLANLQALQPQLMEYALTTGTSRQVSTTAEWSQMVAQLTQAWYMASHLLERPALPPAHDAPQ